MMITYVVTSDSAFGTEEGVFLGEVEEEGRNRRWAERR